MPGHVRRNVQGGCFANIDTWHHKPVTATSPQLPLWKVQDNAHHVLLNKTVNIIN